MNQKRILILLVISVLANSFAYSQPKPSYRWASCGPDRTFNGNPSEVASHPIACTVPRHGDYTVVAVYTTGGDTAERTVWSMDFGSGAANGMTTRRLVCSGVPVQYDSNNRRGPVICSLMQSSPVADSLTAPDSLSLLIGGGDTAGNGIRVAEVMYFNGRTGFGALRRVQAHLAVKYGVTLGAGDYVAPCGRRVWRYSLDSSWHHRITGVGVDSVYGLRQTESRSGHDGAVLTLRADSLGEGVYCLVGDDGGPMEYSGGACLGMEVLGRTWKARVTGADEAPVHGMGPTFGLVFSLHGTGIDGDTLVLLADSAVYLPDSVRGGDHYYSGVTFPSDTAVLRLAHATGIGGALSPRFSSKGLNGDPNVDIALYPNPCGGRYTVDVGTGGTVEIEVYNTSGTRVATHTGSGRGICRFSGELPSSGVYYLAVTANGVRRTLKLVAE